jgi:hypothetical protein
VSLYQNPKTINHKYGLQGPLVQHLKDYIMTPSNLVPGSVWERARKKGASSISRVLFVTNDELQPPQSDRFPPQVVFVSDKLKVLSMDVDSFVGNRTYIGIDDHFKALAEAAVTDPEVLEDEMDDIDFDAVEVPPEDTAPTTPAPITTTDTAKRVQVADMLFGTDEPLAVTGVNGASSPDQLTTQPPALVTATTLSPATQPFGFSVLRGNVALAPLLAVAFAGYAESPFHTGDTQHELKFALGHSFSLADLHLAFKASNEDSVEEFVVASSYETTKVVIHSYVDTFLKIENGLAYGVVFVLSEGDFRGQEYEESQIQAATPTPVVQQVDLGSALPSFDVPATVVIPNLAQPQAPLTATVQVQPTATVQVQVG